MNVKKIAKYIFLSPLYILIIGIMAGMAGLMAYVAFSLFCFVFLTSWLNFFISLAVVWALSIVFYLHSKTYDL